MIIKTPRSWVHALFDIVLTALAWAVFVYLFAGGIFSIVHDSTPGIAVPVAARFLPPMNTLLAYAGVALFNALILLAWAMYNAKRFGGMDRRKTPLPLSEEALAASFGVDARQLDHLHDSRVIVIHHTPEGGISSVDTRMV